MTNIAQAIRPTLLDLWMAHHFDLPKLSEMAEVRADIVQAMMNALPVERQDAIRVLCALSTLLHKECTLSTMYVPLLAPPTENQSEVARLMQRINDEYTSCAQGVHGLAQGIGEHKFITTKMENMYEHLQELRRTVGEEAARQAVMNWPVSESGHA